jgi:hypothetical protein
MDSTLSWRRATSADGAGAGRAATGGTVVRRAEGDTTSRRSRDGAPGPEQMLPTSSGSGCHDGCAGR